MFGLENWSVKKPIEQWTVLDDCNVPMPKMKGGPWIIGGAALEFVQTRDFQNVRDIDYFFKSYSQFDRVTSKFRQIKGAKYDNDADSSYTDKNCNITIGEHTFNLIGFGFASGPDIIADSFDFTVCQVWTDGRIYECSERTSHDIENKILSFTECQERSYELIHNKWDRDLNIQGFEKRIRKYRDKGFEPDDEMIQFILKYL